MTPTQLPLQDAILVDQISQGLLLPLIQPADQHGKKHLQERNIDHGGRVCLTDRDGPPEAVGPSYGT